MKSGKERRKGKRWQVAVLVRCTLPKLSDELVEVEMWAKDVNEKGMQLELAPGLNVSHLAEKGESKESIKHVRFEDFNFSKGSPVKVQDLFYDDEGSPFIEGKITWVRKAPVSGSWVLGVKFDDAKKQPKALLGAFKDFISIVKNPAVAIARASRR
ncbi:MAG: hypothetical protein KCHDKBKB_01726 [Elusimicrobia bacterium]|nr:hypothetical protein [Elusimicrobiota bacterium]